MTSPRANASALVAPSFAHPRRCCRQWTRQNAPHGLEYLEPLWLLHQRRSDPRRCQRTPPEQLGKSRLPMCVFFHSCSSHPTALGLDVLMDDCELRPSFCTCPFTRPQAGRPLRETLQLTPLSLIRKSSQTASRISPTKSTLWD